MLYLKLFEELSIEDLDLIAKKYSKSSYLSSSSIRKMEEIGITLSDFNSLKKKIEYLHTINNLLEDNEELIEILFLALEDKLDYRHIGFKTSKIHTNAKVNIDTALTTSYSDRKDRYVPLSIKDIDQTCFDLIKLILQDKEDLYTTSREKQKTGENNWLYKGNRDYGSLTKWKNRSVFEKLKITFGMSFSLELQLPYNLNKYNYYDDQNDAYDIEEKKRIDTELNKIRWEINQEMSHIFEKFFYLNDIENIKVSVSQRYTYSDSHLPYEAYFTL